MKQVQKHTKNILYAVVWLRRKPNQFEIVLVDIAFFSLSLSLSVSFISTFDSMVIHICNDL